MASTTFFLYKIIILNSAIRVRYVGSVLLKLGYFHWGYLETSQDGESGSACLDKSCTCHALAASFPMLPLVRDIICM